MRIINPDNCLIHNKVFKKSIVDYNIMLKIIEGDNVEVIQSNQDLLAIKSTSTPAWMWVWIDPEKSEVERQALLNDLADYEMESHFDTIWGYEYIVNEFTAIISLNTGVTYKINPGMNAYTCTSPCTNPCKYELLKADEWYIDIVTRIYLESHEDLTLSKAKEITADLIQNGCIYLLKDNKEYVSMVNITHISMGYARINSVYTPIRLRCKGYATDLMVQLSKKLLSDNLVPVLYTEIDNLASNRVYRKVGYVNTGIIVNANLIKD